jgi:hypothetical protein
MKTTEINMLAGKYIFVIALMLAISVGVIAWAGSAGAQTAPYSHGEPPPGVIITPTDSPTSNPTVAPTTIATTPPDVPGPGLDDNVAGIQVHRHPPTIPGSKRLFQGERAGSLPFTGASLMLYLGLGVAAIGGGASLLRASRRRRSDA